MTDELPEPAPGLPPDQQRAEGELAQHAFRTAEVLQLTAGTVSEVARTGRPHRAGNWQLTRDDLIAMTKASDWTGDWDNLTEPAARLVADDLNKHKPWMGEEREVWFRYLRLRQNLGPP